jgi:hypothetical protein
MFALAVVHPLQQQQACIGMQTGFCAETLLPEQTARAMRP